MWVSILFAFAGCLRNYDEPVLPLRPISRLYVAIGIFRTEESRDAKDNVVLIDPADTVLMEVALNHNSDALGGAGIHFNPFVSRVFQSGYSDTTIRIMTVGALGTLGNTGKIGHGDLRALRGIAYHHPSQMLYVASNTTPTAIYGFFQPMNRNGFTRPNRVFRLGTTMRPWGMLLWEGNLLVSNSGDNGGVSLFGDLSQGDSLVTDFQPISSVRIEGATAIRGIAFIDSLDVLVLADYGLLDENGGRVSAGSLHIVEGIKAHLATASATVVPTRTIRGALTGLSGPIDVAIDPRGGKRTIYVADYDNRTISRFSLSDNGNVAPEAIVELDVPTNTRRPFGIFLDARGADQ